MFCVLSYEYQWRNQGFTIDLLGTRNILGKSFEIGTLTIL